MPELTEARKRRFMSRIRNSDTSECWSWLGYVNPYDGYARFGHSGAHRVSYELFVGPIPDGLTVDHLCFNTTCANPQHLRLLTMTENQSNNYNKWKTHCRNGHEFTPENTYVQPGRNRRQCRACQRNAVARYKARRSA